MDIHQKMKDIKKAIEIYKDRKIEFVMKKDSLKTYLFDDEIKDIVSFDMPYRGYINSGIINTFLVNTHEFKGHKSNVVNTFLNQLKESGGVTHITSIFVTENHSHIIQHELQHVFDNIINLKTPVWEHEYRAFLASLIYGDNPNNILLKLVNYVNEPLNEVGFEFFKYNLEYIIKNDRKVEEIEPHELAILKIIVDLDKNIKEKYTNEKIKKTCKELMNKNYIKNVGAKYDEILVELNEQLRGI